MNSLIISGARGRMGRMLAQQAGSFGFAVVAGVDQMADTTGDFPIYARFDQIQETAQVMVDFSSPACLNDLLAYANSHGTACVLGTTGYDEADLQRIQEAATMLAIFQSPNMSRGIYVLRQLAAQAAQMLAGFDIEIIEKHHNQKADSPSGTALALLDSVKSADSIPVFGREGLHTRRKPGEIGLHAVRGGSVPGEHEVGFYGLGEVITLSHAAQSREVFAAGALAAAAFMVGKPAGLYGMADLMNSK